MPGLSWKIRGLTVVIATTLAIAVVLGLYYYRFNAQLDSINTRNFRLLATMSTQIEDVATGYASVVGSLFQNECPEYLVSVDKFLEDQTVLRPNPGFDDARERKADKPFDFRLEPDHNTWMIIDVHPDAAREAKRANAGGECQTRNSAPIHAKVNLTDDIRYLLPADADGGPFDLVVIATDSGEVIYQPPHAQIHLANVQPLFRNAGKSSASKPADSTNTSSDSDPSKTAHPDLFSAVSQTSSLKDVEVAGLMYKIYSQPIKIRSVRGFPEQNWVLFALVRPRNLYTQALRVPYPYLFSFISLLAKARRHLPRRMARHFKERSASWVPSSAHWRRS